MIRSLSYLGLITFRSLIDWTLETVWCTIFYLLMLLVFDHYRLDVVDFNNPQDLEPEEFDQQAGEEGMYSLTMLNLCPFSL
jgi:hypothetical protein